MAQCVELGPDEEIGSDGELTFCKMTTACYQKVMRDNLSHKFRSWHREPSGVCVALCTAGRVIGIVHFEQSGYRGPDTPGVARLLVDLSVRSTIYRHLSKLVIRAAISREARLLVERNYKRRIHAVRTAVFSDHPESMKYRGLYKQIKRVVLPEPGGGYKLTYEGRMTDLPLAEHLRLWLSEENNKRAQV